MFILWSFNQSQASLNKLYRHALRPNQKLNLLLKDALQSLCENGFLLREKGWLSDQFSALIPKKDYLDFLAQDFLSQNPQNSLSDLGIQLLSQYANYMTIEDMEPFFHFSLRKPIIQNKPDARREESSRKLHK